MINDKQRLQEILPRYFRTTRVESFVRQLYAYGFRNIRTCRKEKQVFRNPNFGRDAYHKSATIRRCDERHVVDEQTEIGAAYSLLRKKYEKMWLSAHNLQYQVGNAIDENSERISTLLKFRSNFVERLKVVVLCFAIAVRCWDSKLGAVMEKLVPWVEEVDFGTVGSTVEGSKLDKEAPEDLKRFIENHFMCLGASANDYDALLKISIEHVNQMHFELPQDFFFSATSRFILDDDPGTRIRDLKNFSIILGIKKLFNEIFAIVGGGRLSTDIATPFTNAELEEQAAFVCEPEDPSAILWYITPPNESFEAFARDDSLELPSVSSGNFGM